MSAPTLEKRDSENLMPPNDAPAAPTLLRKRSSEEMARTEPAARRPSNAKKVKSPVERTADLLEAWASGRFNDDDAAYRDFFTPDVVLDASAAAHCGVAEFTQYRGLEGAKAWFAFVATIDFEGVQMAHVAGPGSEVWLRFEAASHVSKKTGKGAAELYSAITVLTWVGGKCAKVVCVPWYPARTAAILSAEDVSVPPAAALPSFEPHAEPMEAYDEAMALWGSGELKKPEVFEKLVSAAAVCDSSDSALPGVLKAYEGADACRKWLDHVEANWEISNMDVVPATGLKPGCVTHRATFDVRHKTTGKVAEKVQMYSELAYNAEGQFVYERKYWVNAPTLASIYSTD